MELVGAHRWRGQATKGVGAVFVGRIDPFKHYVLKKRSRLLQIVYTVPYPTIP